MQQFVLKNKIFDKEKLAQFGFFPNGNKMIYDAKILDNEFLLMIEAFDNVVNTKLIEIESGDEYVLHLSDKATGAFVGKVRTEYNKILDDIIKKCTRYDVFNSTQSQKIVDFVKEEFGDELEFLWESLPLAAIWRRKDNKKWYGIMMSVPISRLGIASDEMVDILNVRADALAIIDNKFIFPAYHMNKKNWVTILLNKECDDEAVYKLIKESYILALGRKR